jgi:predicted Zn-dependent protease
MSDACFRDDAPLTLPPAVQARACRCALHRRRLFTGAIMAAVAAPVLAREGVDVGQNSKWSKFVPAEEIEKTSQQQYLQLKQEASGKKALGPDDHVQVQRLRYIAQRIIPHTYEWNERARQWQWEVNLLGSTQVNAFCMPGGKIAFFTGILTKLQLSDDEVAMIMGHEMAHALREHARERVGKSVATQAGAGILSSLLGLGNAGNMVLNGGAQLLSLKWGRGDESEADLVGLDLAARSGYDPRAGVTLWQKMSKASAGAPPQWLSTHPAGTTRIADIQAQLPKVMPLYQRAGKPERVFGAASLKSSG